MSSWTDLLDDVQFMEYMLLHPPQTKPFMTDAVERSLLSNTTVRNVDKTAETIFDMVCERFKRMYPGGLRINDTDVTREGCYDDRGKQ